MFEPDPEPKTPIRKGADEVFMGGRVIQDGGSGKEKNRRR
jgi:hypothetical protein